MLTFVLLACKPTKYRHTDNFPTSRQNVSLCINRHNGDLCVSCHFSKSTQKRRSQKCRLRRSLSTVTKWPGILQNTGKYRNIGNFWQNIGKYRKARKLTKIQENTGRYDPCNGPKNQVWTWINAHKAWWKYRPVEKTKAFHLSGG